ncbi:MAG: prefoldin subunit alpha [Candidatus Woesearchaeota archaeon]
MSKQKESKKISEEKLKEHYMEMKMIESQLKHLQQQIQQIEEQKVEVASTREALDQIKSSEKEKEILSPISQGIFIKSKLIDNQNVVVNVGANVAVPKSIDETKKLIDKQLLELEKAENELLSHLQKTDEEMTKKATMLQQMMEHD